MCVCARAESARGGGVGARAGTRIRARAEATWRRRREEKRRRRGAKWLSAASRLKVTGLVQKTASRKEVTEDEWEKESRSQPLKRRVKKAGVGGSGGRILGREAGVAGKTEHTGLGF